MTEAHRVMPRAATIKEHRRTRGLTRLLPIVFALLVLLFPQARAQQPARQSDNSSEIKNAAQDSARDEEARQDSARKASESAEPDGNRFIRFFRRTSVEGYVDTYYSYNFNHPASRANLLRAYDTRDRRFTFKAADIAFDKQPTADSRIGFRLDFLFGPAADYLNSEEPGNVRFYRNIHQAYISYLAPVGGRLQIDAGKFIPWVGAEYDDANKNWNYSHGLLYNLAQPSFHAGLRAQYEFSDRVSLLTALVNGWGNIEENNGGKTFGFSLAVKPTGKLSLTQGYIVGPEQPGDNRRLRHLLDSLVSYDFNDRVSVMANYDYGIERLTEGGSARWQGVAGYLRYAPTKRIAFSPRVEFYEDYDGYTTGTAQRLKELTLTGEYKFNRYLLTRLEYRREWSNQSVFERRGAPDFYKTQTTLLGGMIWSFSTRDDETDDATSAGTSAPAPKPRPAAQAAQPPLPTPPQQTSGPRIIPVPISVGDIRTTDSLRAP